MTTESSLRDRLPQIFSAQERDPSTFLIGAESEKFGVHQTTGAPLTYGGAFSVCQVFDHLVTHHGWEPKREVPGGPVLGLSRGRASITLEPGAQLELSGEPLTDLHQVKAEAEGHLRELARVSEEMGLVWLTTGFHPLARREELSWVPKQRYPIMREYLPTKGHAAHDMMLRTATVQGNFDWKDEADAMRKVKVALRMSPLLQAWFQNAPFKEGSAPGSLSFRGQVWRHMDPSRSGLIEKVFDRLEPRYDDYIEWSLDAGMFLIRRQDEVIRNTGQTFRDFLRNGYEGHRATLADYELHLTTLFPEVRLKNTIEVRSVDGLPPDLALASLAVWTGILYDETALLGAEALLAPFEYARVEEERPELIDRGLSAPWSGRDGFAWAMDLFELARAGLERRGRRDENAVSEVAYLSPAQKLLEERTSPALRALAVYRAGGSILSATRLPPLDSV